MGDSPLFHYQPSTGQLTKKTEDHTVAGVLLRAGLISPELAPYHEGRSRLESVDRKLLSVDERMRVSADAFGQSDSDRSLIAIAGDRVACLWHRGTIPTS